MKHGLFASPAAGPRERRLVKAFWLAALLAGILHAWSFRNAMWEGTMSYLDISAAFLDHGWRMLVNSQWSPLYPFLLSLALRALRPAPYWEFPAVHLMDFLIYAGALLCFHFFLAQLARYHRLRAQALALTGDIHLPPASWILLGYSLFLWSSSVLIMRLPAGAADMCVAGFVYLAAGLLLRIRMGLAGWGTFGLLGVVLAFGYFSKAAMFPMAFVFLGAAAFSSGSPRAAAPCVLLAASLFLSISAPFLAALSRAEGHPTFGEAGKFAYAWMVNGVPFVHWQGEPAGSGTPLHPTRKISASPPIYEFASPIQATYPPWVGQPYWLAGLVVRIDRDHQSRALLGNAKVYFNLFLRQGALLACFLTLCLFSGRGRMLLRDIAAEWPLLIPALAALTMYAVVYVEWRYVGAYLVLLWLGAFSGLRLPGSPNNRRLLSCFTVAIASLIGAEIAGLAFYDWSANARTQQSHPHWQVAQALHAMGVAPGDRVALIGLGRDAFWARLARVRIVSELPRESAEEFWAASDEVRSRALRAFASTGAKALVAENIPHYASTAGWRRLANSSCYARFLTPP
jgi:hypothetical protein